MQEMLYVMSEVVEKPILCDMKKSQHYSLMFDKTTDCTVTKQLAVHGRFIESDTGELRSHFLKIIGVLQPEVEGAAGIGETSVSVGARTITRRIE